MVLPPTTDCTADGAVCTGYGKMLSNRSSITVPGPTDDPPENEEPPPKPTGLTATLNSNGSITLNWTAPSDDSVTDYIIFRRRPQQGETSLTIYVSGNGGGQLRQQATQDVSVRTGQIHLVAMAGNSPVYSHGCKSPLPVAEGVAGNPSCRTFGRILYFRYSSQG